MNTTLKFIFVILVVVSISACGGGTGGSSVADDTKSGNESGNSKENTTSYINKDEFGGNTIGIAQYGLLQNANTYIQKLDLTPYDGMLEDIIWREQTTGGDINHAGHFNTHSNQLEDKTYYIFSTDIGHDIDINFDGIAEEPVLVGHYVHAIVRGEWIKNTKKPLRITPLTEYVYEVAGGDKIEFAGLKDRLNTLAKKYIISDVNSDGIIDIKDIITFNPITDKSKAYDPMFDIIVPSMNIFYRYESTFPLSSKYEYTKKVGSIQIECNDYAFAGPNNTIYCGNPLKTIDMSDPYDPKFMNEYSNIVLKGGLLAHIGMSNDGKYLFGFDKNTNDFLAINTNSFTIVKRVSNDKYNDFIISNKRPLMIAGDGKSGKFDLLDISDPSNIKVISSIQGMKNSSPLGMINDEIMYLANFVDGEGKSVIVEKFRFKNLKNPVNEGKFIIDDSSFALYLKGYEWDQFNDYSRKFSTGWRKNDHRIDIYERTEK
ncbi:MAG: hypothetical protein DSZ05_00555 [Sulfurospirillum sp.]|nr:MAG: hypothetical protein DSZ05_00555 [Sulfurospirillum sp.]